MEGTKRKMGIKIKEEDYIGIHRKQEQTPEGGKEKNKKKGIKVQEKEERKKNERWNSR